MQSNTVFLAIYDLRLLIVKSVVDCRLSGVFTDRRKMCQNPVLEENRDLKYISKAEIVKNGILFKKNEKIIFDHFKH